jgi:hypothetical protein
VSKENLRNRGRSPPASRPRSCEPTGFRQVAICDRCVGVAVEEIEKRNGTHGSGDGRVAVERTRLEGAGDHATIRANHAELIRAPLPFAEDGPVPCIPYVPRRLHADLKPEAR